MNVYTLPDLFAGKVSAALCRQWKGRIKGRDWYDFLWYVQRETPLHLAHLEERMRDTGNYSGEIPLSEDQLSELLHQKVESLDLDFVKKDVYPYIKDPRHLDGWTKETFYHAIKFMRFA
ncbi:MAG: hypothetical protein K940chlam7_01302 [Chlamydiae bacterium]|nr:hypothetical protein [Chlamydiota bacterium]